MYVILKNIYYLSQQHTCILYRDGHIDKCTNYTASCSHTFNGSLSIVVPQLNVLIGTFEPGWRVPTSSSIRGTGSRFLTTKGEDKCSVWCGLSSREYKFFLEYTSSSLDTWGMRASIVQEICTSLLQIRHHYIELVNTTQNNC